MISCANSKYQFDEQGSYCLGWWPLGVCPDPLLPSRISLNRRSNYGSTLILALPTRFVFKTNTLIRRWVCKWINRQCFGSILKTFLTGRDIRCNSRKSRERIWTFQMYAHKRFALTSLVSNSTCIKQSSSLLTLGSHPAKRNGRMTRIGSNFYYSHPSK